MSRFNAIGYQTETVQVGELIRIIVSQSDRYRALGEIKLQLEQESITSWIIENPCYQLSEEEHQANRRTDFKVIQL